MNDDLAFGAFPFDFDFTDSFPVGDFDLSNDPGFPRFWENIDDIIGGGLDLLGKLGEMFKDLWDTVWQGLGGAVRWAYNALEDVIGWSKTVLSIAINNVGDAVSWWFSWMHDCVWDAARWVGDKVGDSAGWVWDAAWNAAGWVWGLAGAAIDWSRMVLSTAITNVGDALSWGLDWLWTMASDAGRGIYGGITGAFDWLHGKVAWWGGAVRDWVEDWTDWLWTKASSAYFGITGGVAGGFVWVRDQVLPAVAGAAMDIVGGITGGFEKLGEYMMAPFEWLGGKIKDAFDFVVEGAWEPATEFFDRKLDVVRRLFRGEFETWEDLWTAALNPPVTPLLIPLAFFALLALNAINVATSAVVSEAIEPMIQTQRQTIAARTLMTGDAQDLLLRGEIDEGTFIDHLGRWGYSVDNARHLMTLAQHIPGSGDLVRFAVREAFDRSKAEALGFITPLPGDFSLWMERQGFSTEWSERYWWAHWDLPSTTQGFEMLHRGVIAEPDLEGLLVALDIPPKWIPRLLDISYSPITRVDLRRLYQKGFIDEARLERGYRDIGYNTEDARALTDWTKIAYPRAGEGPPEDLRALTLSTIKQAYVRRLVDRDEALEKLLALDHPEEDAELVLSIWDFDLEWNPSLRFEVPFKDLSRAVVTDAYRRGVFDFNRAAVELVEAGYTQDDAEILLQLEDLKLQQELTDMEIDLILQDARAQDITLAEAETRLLGLGLEPARVTFLVRREELRQLTKTRTLTVSQISRAYRAGIFSEGVFLEKVGAQGYTADDAAVLLGLEGPVEQAKRQLSRSEVERLLRRQEITAADALARLAAMGYLPEDAGLIVGSVERQLERGLVERLLEQALLTRAEALGRLVKAGFSSADADLIVRSREQKMAEEAAEPEPEETPSRELSRTLVEKFLREGLLDREQALERLVRAGFTPGDAELIVLSVERKLAAEAAEA